MKRRSFFALPAALSMLPEAEAATAPAARPFQLGCVTYNVLKDMDLDSAIFELAAFTLFGAAASATDWWLGGSDDTPRRLPRDQFIAHMTTIMIGAINGTARLLGIRFDLDLPVHDAVRREESVG